MVSQKIVIKNASGLHARPAGVLAKEAGKCKSNVTMVVGDRTVDSKKYFKHYGGRNQMWNGSGSSL